MPEPRPLGPKRSMAAMDGLHQGLAYLSPNSENNDFRAIVLFLSSDGTPPTKMEIKDLIFQFLIIPTKPDILNTVESLITLKKPVRDPE